MEAPEMFSERGVRCLDERFDVRGGCETKGKSLGQRWRRIFSRTNPPAIADKIEQCIHEEKATRFKRVDDG
jgi:hypothetical protein